VPPDHVGIALGDRLEQRPVQGKGSRREVGAVEGFRPEGGEGLAHLRQKLPEERVVGGFVDREMEGEVFGTGGPLGEMDTLHLRQSRLHDLEIARRSFPFHRELYDAIVARDAAAARQKTLAILDIVEEDIKEMSK